MQKNSILGHHFLVFRSGGGCTTYEVISIFQVSDFVIFADRNDSRQHQKKKKKHFKIISSTLPNIGVVLLT